MTDADEIRVVVDERPPAWAKWTIRLGATIALLMFAVSMSVAVLYLAPAVDRLSRNVDEAAEAGRAERAALTAQVEAARGQLAAARAVGDVAIDRQTCLTAYTFAVDAAKDEVDAAELGALRVSNQRDTPEYDAAIAAFDAAHKASEQANADRAAYVANRYPLPCPLDGG